MVHVALLNLNLRLMENWRSVPIGPAGAALDPESLMIVMAIIVISAEKVLRSELEPELQTLSQHLPPSRVGRVNLSCIAAATAINRETVRRKVNRLEKAGLVVREKDGIQVVHGIIPYDVVRAIIGAQVDALTRMLNQLTKLGVLTSHDLNRERAPSLDSSSG